MALTSGDYEAQANRLRSQMGRTVDELRSNLTPSKLASEAASRVGITDLSWRGAVDFASTRHPGPTAIAGFGVALWLLAAARKRNKEGVHEVTLPLRESSVSLVDTATRVFRERAEDQAARVYGRRPNPCCERRGNALRRDRTEARGCDRSRPRRLRGPPAHRIDGAGGARDCARRPYAKVVAPAFAVDPGVASQTKGRSPIARGPVLPYLGGKIALLCAL